VVTVCQEIPSPIAGNRSVESHAPDWTDGVVSGDLISTV
jgi:hypothetical protein